MTDSNLNLPLICIGIIMIFITLPWWILVWQAMFRKNVDISESRSLKRFRSQSTLFQRIGKSFRATPWKDDNESVEELSRLVGDLNPPPEEEN